MSTDIFPTNPDLFAPRQPVAAVVKPWKPTPLSHSEWWDKDYQGLYAWRIQTLEALRNDPEMLAAAKLYYSTRPSDWILHWCETYNPKKSTDHIDPLLRGPKWMPFLLFLKQESFIEFLHELRLTGQSGLIEKSRDMGATWLCCAYSVWSWLFIPNDAIGWGSRKEDLVDQIGEPDSIFEKMRLLIDHLPDIWRPVGFTPRKHATFMKLINPENGSIISGESGDNIGRGGRKSIYFKDEAAHYERPEKIQAALDDNTNVQIDISSVNGMGNVFYRRRQGGMEWHRGHDIPPGYVRVLIVDWRDHPEKTQEWYDRRRAQAEREGMLHILAQEVDRDYAAAMQNRIIDGQWIEAAVDAHLKVPYLRIPPPNNWSAALDVADQGLDRNALAMRQWIILRDVTEWGERDPGVTARRAIDICRVHKGIKVQYDSIGVGSNVRSEFNRLVFDDQILNRNDIDLIAWNAGAAVIDPYDNIIPGDDESPINKDHYHNLKAQAWWALRARFYKTFKAVTEGAIYPADELISLDSNMQLLATVKAELSQPVSKQSSTLKTMVDKTPDSTKSPNSADAICMCYFPLPDTGGVVIGGMG